MASYRTRPYRWTLVAVALALCGICAGCTLPSAVTGQQVPITETPFAAVWSEVVTLPTLIPTWIPPTAEATATDEPTGWTGDVSAETVTGTGVPPSAAGAVAGFGDRGDQFAFHFEEARIDDGRVTFVLHQYEFGAAPFAVVFSLSVDPALGVQGAVMPSADSVIIDPEGRHVRLVDRQTWTEYAAPNRSVTVGSLQFEPFELVAGKYTLMIPAIGAPGGQEVPGPWRAMVIEASKPLSMSSSGSLNGEPVLHGNTVVEMWNGLLPSGDIATPAPDALTQPSPASAQVTVAPAWRGGWQFEDSFALRLAGRPAGPSRFVEFDLPRVFGRNYRYRIVDERP